MEHEVLRNTAYILAKEMGTLTLQYHRLGSRRFHPDGGHLSFLSRISGASDNHWRFEQPLAHGPSCWTSTPRQDLSKVSSPAGYHTGRPTPPPGQNLGWAENERVSSRTINISSCSGTRDRGCLNQQANWIIGCMGSRQPVKLNDNHLYADGTVAMEPPTLLFHAHHH
jgi:hypothetical protein